MIRQAAEESPRGNARGNWWRETTPHARILHQVARALSFWRTWRSRRRRAAMQHVSDAWIADHYRQRRPQ
jgi:hypothetical protein